MTVAPSTAAADAADGSVNDGGGAWWREDARWRVLWDAWLCKEEAFMVAWWVQFGRSVEDHSSEPAHPVEVTIVSRMRSRLMMKRNESSW